MPRKKTPKEKKAPKVKRPHTGDKLKRARRRYAKKRHPKSVINHHKRIRGEVEGLNYLLHQLLKTASSTEAKPYNYHPRHHSKDPEYAFSAPAMQEFKRGVPASDVNYWRPQGEGMPPHRGNYPGWQPQWDHPHVGV